MSGYTPREDTLATAIDRIEDLRDAVQAQTQAIHTLIDHLQDIENRLANVEKAVEPPKGESKLEQLLAALVAADQSHAETLHKLGEAIRGLPEVIAEEMAH